MQNVISAMRLVLETSGDPVVRNIIERLSKHLDGKTLTKGEPMAFLISVAIGGVVQTVDLRDERFEVTAVSPSEDLSDAERFATLFRSVGFDCELRRLSRRPPKPRKGQKPAIPVSPLKGDVVHILHLPDD